VIDEQHGLGPHKSFNRIITWNPGDSSWPPADPQQFMWVLDSPRSAAPWKGMSAVDRVFGIQKIAAAQSVLSFSMPLTKPLRELSEELDILSWCTNTQSQGRARSLREGRCARAQYSTPSETRFEAA